MSGTRRCHALVLFRIASPDRQRFFPISPVFVLQQNGNRRANGFAMTHTGDDMGFVSLDLHATAAAKALLATPKFTVEKFLVNAQTCGNAGKKSHKALSVRFSGSKVAQHGSETNH